MRRFWILAGLGLAAIALAAQSKVFYESANHSMRLSATTFGMEGANTAVSHFHGTGNPVEIQARDKGLTITGLSVTGDLARQLDGVDVLQAAEVEGQGKLVRDSAMELAYLTERSGKEKLSEAETKHLAQLKLETSKTTLTTDRFTYAATEQQGTLTIPGAFVVDGTADGQRKTTRKVEGKEIPANENYNQTMKLTGTSGIFTIDPTSTTASSQNPFRKGTIQGLVTFSLHRKAVVAGVKDPSITDVTGKADKVEMDFVTEPHTLTATGNVEMHGTSTYNATMFADVAVITLDDQNKITKIDTKGAPTKTIVKSVGGGK